MSHPLPVCVRKGERRNTNKTKLKIDRSARERSIPDQDICVIHEPRVKLKKTYVNLHVVGVTADVPGALVEHLDVDVGDVLGESPVALASLEATGLLDRGEGGVADVNAGRGPDLRGQSGEGVLDPESNEVARHCGLQRGKRNKECKCCFVSRREERGELEESRMFNY